MKADMATLRMALRKMHARAMGDTSVVYMSIPADRTRDADLLLDDALDELANYRALDQSSVAFPFVPFTPKHTAACADPNCDQSCMKVTP